MTPKITQFIKVILKLWLVAYNVRFELYDIKDYHTRAPPVIQGIYKYKIAAVNVTWDKVILL
jgi:hypothetical protein